ncbi:MAG: ABC transporter permease [Carboxydocellales bacterium]
MSKITPSLTYYVEKDKYMLTNIKEIYHYREMLKNLVVKDLRTRYKGSILGFFWTFLNPLLILAVYTLVFSTVMRMGINNYSMFLFVVLLPWLFFANSVQASTMAIITNGGLVKKIYFPVVILPLSVVLGNLVNYLFSLLIMVPALYFFNIQLTWAVAYFPILLIIQLLLTLSFALLLSSLNVYFRDIEHMLNIFMMAWFYLTPVVYPVTLVPKQYMGLFFLNPLTTIILAYRDIFFYGKPPDLEALGYIGVFSMLFLIVAMFTFNHLKRSFAEEI